MYLFDKAYRKQIRRLLNHTSITAWCNEVHSFPLHHYYLSFQHLNNESLEFQPRARQQNALPHPTGPQIERNYRGCYFQFRCWKKTPRLRLTLYRVLYFAPKTHKPVQVKLTSYCYQRSHHLPNKCTHHSNSQLNDRGRSATNSCPNRLAIPNDRSWWIHQFARPRTLLQRLVWQYCVPSMWPQPHLPRIRIPA